MVFFIFLGFLDIVFAVMMLLTHYEILSSWRIALAGAFFWMGKGVLLRGSFLSVLDFLAGIYFLFVISGLHTPIVFMFLGIMIYKFAVSLMMRG